MHRNTMRAALTGALLAAAAVPAVARTHYTAAPRKPAVVTFVTREYAFDAPDTIEAGATTIKLVNKGSEMHHVWLVRLDGGHTVADVDAALKNPGPPPAWAVTVGGPNAPVPGATSEATLDLKPGNYVALCFIPGPDGAPHFMKGMVRSLVVVPAKDVAPMPSVDATITLNDYGFAFSKPLVAGTQRVAIRNAAEQMHEMLVVRLAPGKTPADMAAWLDKQQGPPPAMPFGGVVGLSKGEQNTITLDLAPGDYGLLCFVPDAKDGKPHVMHGMMHQFSVR